MTGVVEVIEVLQKLRKRACDLFLISLSIYGRLMHSGSVSAFYVERLWSVDPRGNQDFSLFCSRSLQQSNEHVNSFCSIPCQDPDMN
jgi:hypothetical protein